MRRLYSKYMFEWETRMTTRDTNRVVLPFEWGIDWTRDFPLPAAKRGLQLAAHNDDYDLAAEAYLRELNQEIIAHSDDFYTCPKPTDFELISRVIPGDSKPSQLLHFTSAVHTPHPVNNTVVARWFPAKRDAVLSRKSGAPRKAVVMLPHWNSKPGSYVALCRILQKLGLSVLRLSLPYHDSRLPSDTKRSDYAVSPNIGRTISATRQAVLDARCCFDWLEQQGYEKFGIMGTSLGSCYAFLATAHDPRISVNAFNHASMHFADVTWTGQSTRYVRTGIESKLGIDRLRPLWDGVSPVNFFHKFRAEKKRTLLIYATYDLTFLPEYSKIVVEAFRDNKLDHVVRVLPCGHYSTGETPFKFMDGWHIGKFLKTSLR
jgi:hypothetical protein